ncbi:glutathione S-transferase family protein [Candidatus Pantoea floridensis]|uniref:Glutathione S-transferase n=1 Tax=Candidatus Pantoea floridensis TaxID=1938870 RepID=A0A286DMJ6_9GAMM|nr:glutathione S-transferase family protein [Pantoea floridensis]PIF14654.1 glutathione S-transferase [Enterobacteriaceae bacterium JKS000233]SOD59841.1 Glutathione S-transferase [Pantoea floridensis]
MMQLYYASTSAYVRKVMVTAHCLGLLDEITLLASAAHPIERDERIASINPLAKVPALRTETDLCLYDSRVICEYLNARAQGNLLPAHGESRWVSLARQALGDGLIDAALLARYEFSARPAEKQWPGWADAQLKKVSAALGEIERQVVGFNTLPDDIGLIAIGCALGYLDFRFAGMNWRKQHPLTAAWFAIFDAHPAMAATRPH